MPSKRNTNKLYFIIVVIFSSLLIFSFLPYFVLRLNYSKKYYDYVSEYSSAYGVEESLILAVIKCESKFNSYAVSNKGAKGLMQITDSTFNYCCDILGITGDVFSPKDNINVGTYYLSYLLNKFTVTETALCAYNAGEGVVYGWLNNKELSYDGIVLNKIPYPETYAYVNKVLWAQKVYKFLYE